MPRNSEINPHVHVPCEKIGTHRNFIQENRLNVEIYFSSDCLDSLEIDAMRRLYDSLHHKPSLTFHAPFMDLSPGAVDSKVRGVTSERFNRVFDIASVLKPKCVVFHSGYEKWKYALKTDLWLTKSLQTWRPLQERAQALGVQIAIENIFEDDPSSLRLLMEAMDAEDFGICFDSGHWNLFSKVPLVEWLRLLAPYIIELHLHDNDKSSDSHDPIGEGDFDFPALFTAIRGKRCIYTIEARSPEGVMKSIDRLRQYLSVQ